MNFMWLMFLIVLVAVVCTAREIIRSWRRHPVDCTALPQSARSDSIEAPRSSALHQHHAKWISMDECETWHNHALPGVR